MGMFVRIWTETAFVPLRDPAGLPGLRLWGETMNESGWRMRA